MFRISNLCSAVFVLWHFLIALSERESIDYLTPFGVYVQTTRYNVSIYFQQTNDRVLLPFNKRMLYKFDGPLFFLVACLLAAAAAAWCLSHLFRTGFTLNCTEEKNTNVAIACSNMAWLSLFCDCMCVFVCSLTCSHAVHSPCSLTCSVVQTNVRSLVRSFA